jgi:putative phosphoesterase
MKLAVFSDSHGDTKYLETAASHAIYRGRAEVLIHLGDNYDDASVLTQFNRRLLRVPGVFAPEYQNPSVANRIVETFGPWSVLISHTSQKHPNDLETDLDPAELIRSRAVHIILHGHTHEPRIVEEGGVWYVNPGHLKRQDKKNHPASFALLDLTDSSAAVQIYDVLSRAELMRKQFPFK